MLQGRPLVGMSWNYNFFFCNGFFGYKLKGNGVSLGNLICLDVVIFGYKCQIIKLVLAIANFHKKKSRLPFTKTWRD